MARIEKLEPTEMNRNSIHAVVDASFIVFTGSDGEKYLQIDTYGSPDREFPGKKSQSIQFGPEGIQQLSEILLSIR